MLEDNFHKTQSMFDINVKAKGDLHIDFHHTTEDGACSFGGGVAPRKILGRQKSESRAFYCPGLYLQWTRHYQEWCEDCSNRPYSSVES